MNRKLYRILNIVVYRTIAFLFKMSYIIFFRIRIYGKQNIPRHGACIMASNHASYLDPPIVGTCHWREMYYFARSTLMKTKWTDLLFDLLNCIPVDRDNPSIGTLKSAINVLKRGYPLLLFPEGTRTETGELQDGKMGIGFIAHKAKVPIIPFYIHGSFDILPKGRNKIQFKKLRVQIGRPLDFSHLWDKKGNESLYLSISQQVMESIKKLKEELLRKIA